MTGIAGTFYYLGDFVTKQIEGLLGQYGRLRLSLGLEKFHGIIITCFTDKNRRPRWIVHRRVFRSQGEGKLKETNAKTCGPRYTLTINKAQISILPFCFRVIPTNGVLPCSIMLNTNPSLAPQLSSEYIQTCSKYMCCQNRKKGEMYTKLLAA